MRQENTKPNIMVMSGYGLNCEEETKFAFERAGGRADIVHINDLIEKPAMLRRYDILAFPGGFSYGDDTGSGKAYANKFKNHLSKELEAFLKRDTLMIGICNGFQILTSLGVLRGALSYNKGGKYIDRWVDLKTAKSASPWLAGLGKLSLPIAHGEGRYIVGPDAAETAFTYDKGEICAFQNLEKNPNGSERDIAGVLGYNGRVLGMMPHPERGMFFIQRPDYFEKREALARKGARVPEEGPGLAIFRNGVNYFTKR